MHSMPFFCPQNGANAATAWWWFLVWMILSTSSCWSLEQTHAQQREPSFLRQLQGNPNDDDDFSCNVPADRCPTKFNRQCDNNNGNPDCAVGDCFDCDLCRQFDYDCNACLQQRGCLWCPGDALCYNSPFYSIIGAQSSCTDPFEDYTEDSCSPEKTDTFFDDPLYYAQSWVFDMINVQPVWEQGYFGNGIRVRVNDNGVESSHAEFQDRIDASASCNILDPPPEEYAKTDMSGNHGTSVAAILGGAANNGVCSVGVAPQVTLSACYAFGQEPFLGFQVDKFDISQNSFGIDGCRNPNGRRQRELQKNDACPFTRLDNFFNLVYPCDVCDFSVDDDVLSDACESAIVQHCRRLYEQDVAACLDFLDLLVRGGKCEFDTLTDIEQEGLTTGILQGRDGKGIVYLFAAGNSYAYGDDSNFQSFTNSRLVISVGAVGKDGSHASYSTPGASLFVTGPGGDGESLSNHITAGLGGTCVDAQVGTSNACPVVSAVVALMLEVNPDLTWRDVQGIIATTSQRVTNDPDDDTAQVNGAGIWHSNFYGFGIVDAAAAVEAAQTWQLFGSEQRVIGESGILDLPLLEMNGSVETDLSLLPVGSGNFVAESINVFLDLQHFSRGHLQIVLTSPQGTKSILSPGQRPENTVLGADERWKLLTVRHWGESPFGVWRLEIVDLKEGDVDECASAAWTLPNSNGVDCRSIERSRWCVDGALDPLGLLPRDQFDFLFSAVVSGRTAQEACCECGGGLDANQVENKLRQWRIVVHGRIQLDSPTDSPVSPGPSVAPSGSPSTIPSLLPSRAPSSTPSLLPSGSPSSMPSFVPSAPSTVGPTGAPTESTSTISPTDMKLLPSDQPSEPISELPTQTPTTSPPPTTTFSPTPNATDASAAPTSTATGRNTGEPTTSSGASRWGYLYFSFLSNSIALSLPSLVFMFMG